MHWAKLWPINHILTRRPVRSLSAVSRPRAVESILANLPVQCLGGYPENRRGATLMPIRPGQHAFDMATLELCERHVLSASVGRPVRRVGGVEREIARLDDPTVREQHGALHDVSELPHV